MTEPVLIIGGGLIGSSIAWRLAQKGVPCVIADAGPLGGEASTAGAGMLSPGGEFEEPSPWVELGLQSLRRYPGFVAELTQESGEDLDFRVTGCIHFEENPPQARVDYQDRAGIHVERCPEGLFYPRDAQVNPVAMLRALRHAAQTRGVRIDHSRVAAIEADAYRAVVVAAGAWSGRLQILHDRRPVALPASEPVKGHLIGFQMEPGLLGPFLRRDSTYVLQRSDGFVIAGTTEEHAGFDTSVDAETCAEIHRQAAGIVPEIASAEPVKRWIGFRPGPFYPDGPRVGRVEGTDVWTAYGHFRNGILLTPLTAERIAGEIAGAI